MLLWLVLAALTVIALLGAVMPLLRKPHVQNQRSEYDLEVYRHQLEELQNELERGVITPEEENAARLEIERRILVTAEMEDSLVGNPSSTLQIVGVLIVAISIPALASGLYLYIGNPQAPDQPLTARTPVEATQSASAGDLETVISRLRARLARDSGGLADWLLLGQSYNVMRRYEEAVAAYRRADGLQPDNVNIMTSLGETLVLAASGTVTPEAQSVFRNAHLLDEQTPGPRFYLGLARAQAGDYWGAYDFWLALANDAPADATWLPQVVAHLEEVSMELGVDVSAALNSRSNPIVSPKQIPLPGPTREDIEAASGMSASNRMEMIRGMVAGLAERLKENPDNIEGWERLARSYQVLGETDKAAEARARAHTLRQALSTNISPAPTKRRGPSQAAIANAKGMSSEDRSEMIASMVEGLAQRLEEDPSDIQGWIMLARSYQVMKQPEKAQYALRRATEAAPNDPSILVQLGAAIVDNSDQGAPLPKSAVSIFQRVLEIDAKNPDAMYFIGMAQAQSGDKQQARNTWTQLLAQLDESSRAYEIVRRQIKRLHTR